MSASPSHHTALFYTVLLFLLLPLLFSSCSSRKQVSQPEPYTVSPSTPATQRPYTISGKTYYPIKSSKGFKQKGVASWYGPDFHGKKTSNGEIYNMHANTAAHKTLPMNTLLRVRNLDNGKEAIVRINDRGPFVDGRVIDVSYAIAKKIGLVRTGTARVKLTALPSDSPCTVAPVPVISQTKSKKIIQSEPVNIYYVEIAVLSDQKRALHLQQRFLAAKFPTLLERTTDATGTAASPMYHVLVYVGEKQHDAIFARHALLNKGYRNARIVSRRE